MTRSRKLAREIAKEGQRRSPRISALEAHHCPSSSPSPCMSHLDSQTTKKRKLRRVQELTCTTASAASPLSPPNHQTVKHSHNQGVLKKSDQPLKTPPLTFVPEKRILELVVDTLQRRDTYEIFAEPVDPNEVEDYYAIIEEPMDFGTMRAKLHEGMYKSLDQFEHDVFLIFNNAMHFNSSGTIYFRQARSINELAKKVFDVLKTNPEKFELEFSETKRKVGRRNPGAGFRDSTDTKFSEIAIDVSSKSTVPCSSRGTSHRKSFKANHAIAKHIDGSDLEVQLQLGTKDSGRYRSFEDDKRCTYRILSLGEDDSKFSTVYGKLKVLERVNQQDVGYRDSLMLFVKDLGPTAKNIAKRKVLGCEICTASSTFNNTAVTAASTCHDQYPKAKGKMDLQIARGGETAYITDDNANNKVEGLGGTLNVNAYYKDNSHGSHSHRRSLGIIGCDDIDKAKAGFLNQSFCVEDLNVSYRGSKETNESKMETNKCNKFQSLPWPLESFFQGKSQPVTAMGDRQRTAADCLTREISSTSESADQTIPLASSFVFNLPYLKTRLDQINSSEQQDSSGNQGPFFANQLRHQ